MSFYNTICSTSWQEVTESIINKTQDDVESALSSRIRSVEDFKAMISPAAQPYLEDMAKLSMQITQQRFGKTIQLYLPLYLSNECTNSCIYCGFNRENKVTRLTLSFKQVEKELQCINKMGYKHLLLVTGEHPKACSLEYLAEVVKMAKRYFSLISLEVAPMESNEYASLSRLGIHTVYIYQETYHKEKYGVYHPKGKKADYRYRLETPERLGEAGIHKIGLGCLLGLEDWRTDSTFTAMHLKYLERKYWKTKYSLSFPRLRPHAGNFQPNSIVSDKDLLQLICAYRIFNPDVELSLSTRESEIFRDNMLRLGVTSMSAGSITQPGGYSQSYDSKLEQFAVHDARSPQQVADMIHSKGYEAVWKDWETFK